MKKLILYAIFLNTAACNSNSLDLPIYHSADFTPVWNSEDISKQHYVEDFQLIDQRGNDYGSQQLKGKIHIMNCFFTVCPSLCPLLMGNLKPVQEAFINDEQVRMISLSVTPARDSVEKLMKYAQTNKIDSNIWHLLRGDKKKIYDLARKSYFVDENIGTELGENDFLHTENIILVDEKMQIRGIYNGSLQLEIKQLIEDIDVLKQEIETNS